MASLASKPKTTTVAAGPITNLPLVRRKGGGTNYLAWKEFTIVKLKAKFPTIYEEFLVQTPVETDAELAARVSALYPPIPLLNSQSAVVPEADYQAGLLIANLTERTRFWTISLEAMQEGRRATNAITVRRNETDSVIIKTRMESEAKKRDLRISMAALLLSPEFVSADCLVTIQSDGRFLPNGGLNSSFTIHQIVKDTLPEHPGPANQQRLLAERSLRSMIQGSTRLDIFNTLFKQRRDACRELGAVHDEPTLIDIYIASLNVEIFELFKTGYYQDPTKYANTVNAVIVEADEYFATRCAVNPAIAKILGNPLGYAVYATQEDDPEDHDDIVSQVGSDITAPVKSTIPAPVIDPKPMPLKCQLCGKRGHTADNCRTLKNPESIKKYIASANFQDTSTRKPDGVQLVSVGAQISETPDISLVLSTTVADGEDIAACSVAYPSMPFEVLCMAVQSEGDDGLIDWEHDDHADVHVICSQEGAEFFETLKPCSTRIVGFSSNISEQVKGRGPLIRDMGIGVWVEAATKMLMSAIQLRKAYTRVPTDGASICYVHKVDKSVITFRLGPDGYFHTKLASSDRPSVCSVDFYNPPSLRPVDPSKAMATWSSIYAVERLHWASNHSSSSTMKRLCTDPSYIGDVTPGDIDLFYAHRGCSACLSGRMRHHAQHPSTRGLSQVVGHTVQGDFFFIEAGAGKIPVLLLTDECSMFTFMYAFVGCNRVDGPTRKMCTKAEFKIAITAMVGAWNRAGRTCRMIRFDREGLVVATDVAQWMEMTRGIRLIPTAADHKLGLIEVQGRIVKDACRSMVVGIQERFGYVYPKIYYPQLVGDVCSLMNRTGRRDPDVPAWNMMFDSTHEKGLDVRRDLRVSIGEMVLVKQPRQLASPISEAKAEWGVVVSRSFNGSGVFEVHLLEMGSRVHRFKFARAVTIPIHIMEKARELDKNHVVMPPPPPPLPEAIEAVPANPAGHEAGEMVPPALDEGEGEDEIDEDPAEGETEEVIPAIEEMVGMTQVSYSKGLLQSGVRATQAMRVEIQGFLDKMMLHPTHYSDIPDEEKDQILRSLDGYKDRIGQPTGKARVFIDGSSQLPELVGDCYAPVARNESNFVVLAVAAHRGYRIGSVDNKQAFTTVSRPEKDCYRYLRLSRDIAAIVVELAPHMAKYLGRKGELYVLLDKMLYGDKRAPKLWYEKLMKVYTDMGFTINKADPCLIHYSSPRGTIHGAITVDDTLFAYSSSEVMKELEDAYVTAFGRDGFTMELGATFTHLGMELSQNLEDGSIAVSQRAFVTDLLGQATAMIDKFGVKRGGTPADPKIFDPVESPPLSMEDKDIYRSLNMSLMFAATRTFPECLVAATACASRFTQATEDDMRRLLKAITYMNKDPDHCVTIRPASENIVCSADCSYAVHPDGYSHDAVAMGFEGTDDAPDSFFIFSSGKQTTIAKSSCHGELTSANVGADFIVWGRQVMEGFGIQDASPSRLDRKGMDGVSEDVDPTPSVLRQDNMSTIHLIVKGRGSFRNSKHIRVREHFIRDLVRDKEIVVKWQHTTEMVADLLSKGVSLNVFNRLLEALIGKRSRRE